MKVERHKHDYYQPGALIYRDEVDIKDGGDETSTTRSSWEIIDSNPNNNQLSLSYTPPVDAIALIYGQATYVYSEANASLYFGIFHGATALAQNYQFIDTITTGRTFTSMHYMELTAGTAYTFTGKYYINEASGTLTIAEENYETFLHLLVWRKP